MRCISSDFRNIVIVLSMIFVYGVFQGRVTEIKWMLQKYFGAVFLPKTEQTMEILSSHDTYCVLNVLRSHPLRTRCSKMATRNAVRCVNRIEAIGAIKLLIALNVLV